MLLICAAALSCGKERVEYPGGIRYPGRTKIGFSTGFSSPAQTRAAALTSVPDLAQQGGFRVWAYTHGTSQWASASATSKNAILTNTLVTGATAGGTTTWTYNDPVEWPMDTYVSFFACGPAGPAANATITGTTAEGVPTLDFTVHNTPAYQVDYLIAKPLLNQTAPTYANDTPVNVRFEHALARIVFSGIVLNMPEGREIKIRDITLAGLYSAGSTRITTDPVQWTVSGQPAATYTVTVGSGLEDVALSEASQFVSSANGNLFLMPQSLVREPNVEPTMKVTIEIDGNPIEYPAAPLFSPDAWQSGKTYNYHVVVDGESLHIIGVEIGVIANPWEIAEYINPVMMVAKKDELNRRKIDAAMKSLEQLSHTTYPITSSKYFALYISGAMDMEVTIDMKKYPSFKEGDVVMIDAKKLVTRWDSPELSAGGAPHQGTATANNYKLEVKYNDDYWKLSAAAQPYPNIWSDPEVDGFSGPTRPFTEGSSIYLLSPEIQNRGSIIVVKTTDAVEPQ